MFKRWPLSTLLMVSGRVGFFYSETFVLIKIQQCNYALDNNLDYICVVLLCLSNFSISNL